LNLKKAQARLEYCQEKAERVRHWQQSVQHELFEYEGRTSQLTRLIDADVPRAKKVLTQIIRHLEEYQSLRAREPGSAYNDVALAKELFTNDSSPAADASSAEVPAAPDQKDPKDQGDTNAPGIESEA